MSWDIALCDRKTGEELSLPVPLFVRGGTIPAVQNPYTGELEQAPTETASINITWNYSPYYYEATEGDKRFLHQEDGEEPSYGIRGIYGKTPEESIPMLKDMVERIRKKYMNDDGIWKMSERKRVRYFDENGKEVRDAFGAVLKKIPMTEKEEVYQVSEGDTSNYWEKTAMNAIIPLYHMMALAIQCFFEDCVWQGD